MDLDVARFNLTSENEVAADELLSPSKVRQSGHCLSSGMHTLFLRTTAMP